MFAMRGFMRRFARRCRDGLSYGAHAWVALTDTEQTALAVVVGLLLIGIAIRLWRQP